MTENGSGCKPRLSDQVVNECQRCAEFLTARAGAVLRQCGCRLQNQVGFGDKVFQSVQFGFRRWHNFTLRRMLADCKR